MLAHLKIINCVRALTKILFYIRNCTEVQSSLHDLIKTKQNLVPIIPCGIKSGCLCKKHAFFFVNLCEKYLFQKVFWSIFFSKVCRAEFLCRVLSCSWISLFLHSSQSTKIGRNTESWCFRSFITTRKKSTKLVRCNHHHYHRHPLKTLHPTRQLLQNTDHGDY